MGIHILTEPCIFVSPFLDMILYLQLPYFFVLCSQVSAVHRQWFCSYTEKLRGPSKPIEKLDFTLVLTMLYPFKITIIVKTSLHIPINHTCLVFHMLYELLKMSYAS